MDNILMRLTNCPGWRQLWIAGRAGITILYQVKNLPRGVAMAKIFEFPSDALRIQAKIEKRLAQTMERLPQELVECISAAIKEVTSKWVQRLGFTMDSGSFHPGTRKGDIRFC
jgi:hypothetical protein